MHRLQELSNVLEPLAMRAGCGGADQQCVLLLTLSKSFSRPGGADQQCALLLTLSKLFSPPHALISNLLPSSDQHWPGGADQQCALLLTIGLEKLISNVLSNATPKQFRGSYINGGALASFAQHPIIGGTLSGCLAVGVLRGSGCVTPFEGQGCAVCLRMGVLSSTGCLHQLTVAFNGLVTIGCLPEGGCVRQWRFQLGLGAFHRCGSGHHEVIADLGAKMQQRVGGLGAIAVEHIAGGHQGREPPSHGSASNHVGEWIEVHGGNYA
eukprot:1161827-Pelagomonas_calceolata.AAC.3